MTKLKLTYFDFEGIRGAAVRLAMYASKLEFEDHRISWDQFAQVKSQHPFGALPVLYVDGKVLAQSNAIMRYIGKLSNLYPSDPWQAAVCDQAMDAVEELTVKLTDTIALPDEEKKAKRQALVAETLPVFLSGLENILKEGGGNYIANNEFTVADVRVYDLIRWLRSGLDHIPADLVERVAPLLAKHMDMVKNEPRIKAYYDKLKV